MNTFQCLVLIAAIGFIITTTSTVSAADYICYSDIQCKDNVTWVSSVIHYTKPS